MSNPSEALVLALAGTLSTSAFVFPVLKERRWEERDSGKAATTILLLQDLFVAPLLVQGRNLKQIYDYSRTEEILKDSRDAGRASSAEASRSLKTSVRKWLGFDN